MAGCFKSHDRISTFTDRVMGIRVITSRESVSRRRRGTSPGTLAGISPWVKDGLDIEYLAGDLRRVAFASDGRPSGWSDVEAAQLRLIVQCLKGAAIESDLLSSRQLRLQPDPGRGGHTASLSVRKTLVIAFKAAGGVTTAILDVLPIRSDRRR